MSKLEQLIYQVLVRKNGMTDLVQCDCSALPTELPPQSCLYDRVAAISDKRQLPPAR